MPAEYAVKAREGYDTVAEHGQQVVKQWRGEAADEIVEISEAVEPKAEPAKDSASNDPAKADAGSDTGYGAASDGGADKPAGQEGHGAQGPGEEDRRQGRRVAVVRFAQLEPHRPVRGAGTFRVSAPFS